MEAAEKEKKIVTLTEVKPTQDGYRWVAITAMLLAIGIILHTVSPNVGGVTPNWTIAMYSIVINLTNPSLPQALGIGFISGMTLVPSSKSALPVRFAARWCAASWLRPCLPLNLKNGACARLLQALWQQW